MKEYKESTGQDHKIAEIKIQVEDNALTKYEERTAKVLATQNEKKQKILTDRDELYKKADELEGKRVEEEKAWEEEKKRLLEEAEARRIAAEEERKRLEAEAEAKRLAELAEAERLRKEKIMNDSPRGTCT